MSKRRNPRRAAVLVTRNCLHNSDSNSDDEDFMPESNIQFRSKSISPKRKCIAKKTITKKKPVTRKSNRNKPLNYTVTSEVIDLESNLNPNENATSVNSEAFKDIYQKNVENKVDNFFKSRNLLSDDEDEELSILPKNELSKPVKVSKQFYEISDSEDDDNPSTSKMKDVIQPKVIEDVSKNTDKELLDMVDNILECNDAPTEANTTQIDNWNEFKSKADEILGSVTALLDTLKEDKDKPKKVQPKPVKTKPTCPICLEVLDGNTVPGATTCGHIFCMECIKQVAKTLKKCPTCRKPITVKKIHPLYL